MTRPADHALQQLVAAKAHYRTLLDAAIETYHELAEELSDRQSLSPAAEADVSWALRCLRAQIAHWEALGAQMGHVIDTMVDDHWSRQIQAEVERLDDDLRTLGRRADEG